MLAKRSDKDVLLNGGFFFHVGTFIPSKNYMLEVEFKNDPDFTEDKFKPGIDFELGNMFRITSPDPMAIGVRATWFTAGLTTLTIDDTTGAKALNGSVLRVGPYFTYKLSDNMAVDAFYQIGANYFILLDQDWNDMGWNGALGATHELGFTYRLSVLSVGFGYRFGRVLDVEYKKEEDSDYKTWYQFITTNVRFFIGIKI